MTRVVDRTDTRMKSAKALWFLEVGDNRPTRPLDVQKAYNKVKAEMLRKAVRFEKLLDQLGYEVRPKEFEKSRD